VGLGFVRCWCWFRLTIGRLSWGLGTVGCGSDWDFKVGSELGTTTPESDTNLDSQPPKRSTTTSSSPKRVQQRNKNTSTSDQSTPQYGPSNNVSYQDLDNSIGRWSHSWPSSYCVYYPGLQRVL
jgi:hypothetical protein